MKWLQEKTTPKPVVDNVKTVRFANGTGNNKKSIHMYLSKSLIDEAIEKEFSYIRIGVDELDGKKVLGFNMNKAYGGMPLKNKSGEYKKVFNINRFIGGYKEEGVELPLDQRLELTKDGQNYIYIL